MKDYLTIGDLAKLMNVSTHQIRYFEEKGILFPDKVDENGYRKYGIKSIYLLSHILYLRDFDISVSNIKKCFNSFSQEEYYQLLSSKIYEIEEKIKSLEQLKNQTLSVIDCLERASDETNRIAIKHFSKRIIRKVCKVYKNNNLTAKEIYKYFIGVSDLYKVDIIIFLNNLSSYVAYEVDEYNKKDCLILPESNYLTSMIAVEKDDEIDLAVEEMWKYAKDNGIKLEKKILIKQNSKLSITQNDKIYYDIEIRILE